MKHLEPTRIVRNALVTIALLLVAGLLAQFLTNLPGERVVAQAPPELRLRLAITDGWAYTMESGPHYILGLVPVPRGQLATNCLPIAGRPSCLPR